MNISPIPLCADTVTPHRETEYAVDALNGGRIRPYAYVNLLQRGLAAYARQPYALAVNSAHAALHLALFELGVGPGDEVVIPDLAEEFVPAAVLHVGAKPVFCGR